MKVFCQNVNGLNLDLATELAASHTYDVLGLCETWCTSLPKQFIQKVLNLRYRVFYVNAFVSKLGHSSGGLLLLVRSDAKPSLRSTMSSKNVL